MCYYRLIALRGGAIMDIVEKIKQGTPEYIVMLERDWN